MDYLGPAIDRNSERWMDYIVSDQLQPAERNVHSQKEAVEKLADWLRDRGQWLDNNINSLYQYCADSKNKKYNESWVVFQPHTYSRTFNLLNDFANALLSFDHIIVTDIYAARETNTYNISSKDLVDAIVKLGKNAQYIPALEDCAKYLKENVKENDIVLTLGAGTVTKIGSMLKDAD